jgi:hypothetical protein
VPAHATVPGGTRHRSRGGTRRRQPPEQGWSLLCNGVVVFEDTVELLPGGEIIAPHRTAALG